MTSVKTVDEENKRLKQLVADLPRAYVELYATK